MEENFNKMKSNIDRPKPQAIIKTYVLQFIYQNGNGWAFVNATSVNQAETVFKTQTRYREAKVTNIKEARWYGDNMQVVFEGAVTTYPTVDLDKIISKEDLKDIIENTIKDNLPDLGLQYCTEAQVQQIVSGAIKNLSPPDLTEYYTAAEVNKAIKIAINNIPVVPGPQGPTGPQGPQGPQGVAGHSPNVTINSQGYWVIDGVPTETSAIGPKGEDGRDGEDGTTPDMSDYMTAEEVQAAIDDAIDDITPGSHTPVDDEEIQNLINSVALLQAAFNDAVTEGNISSPVGIGNFQQAYNKSKEAGMSSTLFTWMLDDIDDKGRTVKKLIYHIGNGEFIDAIGATIVGNLEGLTIVTKGTAKLRIGTVNDSTYDITLQKGVNNFTVNGRHLVGGNASNSFNYLDENGNITYMKFVENPSNIVDVDFGGIGYKVASPSTYTGNFRADLTSLRSVRRMKAVGSLNQCFSGNTSVQYIQIYSDSVIDQSSIAGNRGGETFKGTSNLRYLDIKNLKVIPEKMSSYFNGCGATVYDIRNFQLPSNPQLSNTFDYSAVGTIIIGAGFNVPNVNITSPTDNTPGALTIVCVSEVPPVCLKRWMPSRCTIKVPPGCTDAYRTAWSSILTSEMEIVEYRENEY